MPGAQVPQRDPLLAIAEALEWGLTEGAIP